MEQLQQGFNYSFRLSKAGSEKSAERLNSALQFISISQISTQQYRSGHFDPF